MSKINTREELTKTWNKRAEVLVGKKIKQARYMTEAEAEEFGWYSRGIVIFFEDGSHIIPMRDDEGNDAGSVDGSDDKLVFPVLR
tara:strand:- start:17 stop:271 length:255 start_codon:yes stop_codon:yes gene_type:complete